jgi:hypothetical protein
VFVVQGNPPISNLQEVKVGIRDGELIEILSGIDSNDRIVTLGSRMLKHGQQVKPIEVSLPKELPQTSDSAAED